MSKFVNEIIESIYSDKDQWSMYCFHRYATGIKKDNIAIDQYGNTRLLSIINVLIDGKEIPITYIDKFKLEVAVKWWYKNIDLNNLRSK